MRKFFLGLVAVLTSTTALAEVQSASPVSVIGADEIGQLPATDLEDLLANVPNASVTSGGNIPAQTGFSIRGIAQTEYRAWSYTDEFAVGVNATLDYGILVGNGVIKAGVEIFADYDSNASDVYIDARPFVSYEWNQTKISVGNIRSTYDYINRPMNWTTSYIKDYSSGYALGARVDTTLGRARVSASYNEYDELSLGAVYPINDTTRVYAAGLTQLDSDYYRTTFGVLGNLGNVDYRVGYTCDSFDYHEMEVEAAYDVSDRITGVGYVGMQKYGANTDWYYSLGGYYHLNDKLDLFAGYEGGNGYSEITIGAMFAFGAGQDRGPSDNLIVLLRPTLSTMRE